MSTPPNPASPPPAPAPGAVQAGAAPAAAPQQMLPVPVILGAMLRASKNVSDLIFSPGRFPQVEQGGQLVPVKIAGLSVLTPEDTARIASHLIGANKGAMEKLKADGSCDISYSLQRVSRFRVNIFTQRG